MKKILLIMAIFFVFLVEISGATDFGTAMSITTINIPASADVAAMGNADAAAWSLSSNNPALTAYELPENKHKSGVNATFGLLHFKKGPAVRFTSDSIGTKTQYGFFSATVSYFQSGKNSTRMGTDLEFRPSKMLELMWANKIASNWLKQGDELYLGLELAYSKSKPNFSLRDQRVLRSESTGNDVTVGFLYKPTAKLNIGGYYGRFLDHSREKDFIFKNSMSGNSISHQFKFGASYQILSKTFVACDVQLLNIAGKKKSQLFAGVEQGIIKDVLCLYAGAADGSPTGGLEISCRRGGIDLSYTSNASPYANKYLGRSKLAMVSIFFSF